MLFRKVVLPVPLGPEIDIISPFDISNSKVQLNGLLAGYKLSFKERSHFMSNLNSTNLLSV